MRGTFLFRYIYARVIFTLDVVGLSEYKKRVSSVTWQGKREGYTAVVFKFCLKILKFCLNQSNLLGISFFFTYFCTLIELTPMRVSRYIIYMQHRFNKLYLMMMAVMIGITGCNNTADTQMAVLTDKNFDEGKAMADSLYRRMQFRDAYKLYLQLLDSKEVETDNEKKLRVLSSLSNASELSGHKAEEHKWLQQQMDLAEETGNDYYHALALISMGQNIFFEGNREKGIQYVNEAIDLMAKTDCDDADHLTHGFLNLLASLYSEMKDYDNALQTVERNLQLTMEGTRWGASQNQQLIDRRMALAKKAALLARMGINSSGSQKSAYFQRADSAYAAWKSVQYEGNHTRDYFIVDYMKRRGLHREAVTIYNDLIERIRLQGDTLGEMMNTAKWGLADVYHQMGRGEQAATLYEQVLEIQDTLKTRKARNTAQELAAVYHAKEQEQKIMEQEAENTRQRYLLFIVIAVLLAVAALAAIVIVKNRIISRKNRLLAQQIADAVNYRDMYWKEKLTMTPIADDTTDLNTLSDEQLFQYINEVILREQLFLDPRFERQSIMDRFHLSKERVGTIFSKGSEHGKMSNYIQQLRLDYAVHQLVEQPDKSIVQIASDSGFSSSTYFSDRFRQNFGMSPSDFRKTSLGSDKV